MKILIDEYITGGGLFEADESWPPAVSLLQEALAMANSLAEDFSSLEQVDVLITRDSRLRDHPQHQSRRLQKCQTLWFSNDHQRTETLIKLYSKADWVVVIAPEFDDILMRQVQRVVGNGGRVLGPGLEMIQLASAKHRCAQYLNSHSVPVATGIQLAAGQQLTAHEDFETISFPAIIKPNDGAGSINVKLLQSTTDFTESNIATRVENFYPGTAVSVALLTVEDCTLNLEPCQQNISRDGSFTYLGGSLPLTTSLAQRATALALQVARCFPTSLGYYCIDMILGPSVDGSDDVVIEVNPRLTTSYGGLRGFYKQNLAQAMLNLALGHPYSLTKKNRTIDFQADGSLTWQSSVADELQSART